MQASDGGGGGSRGRRGEHGGHARMCLEAQAHINVWPAGMQAVRAILSAWK